MQPVTQTISGPVSEEGPVLEQTTELRPESPPAAAPVSRPFLPSPPSSSSQQPFSQTSAFSPFSPTAGASIGAGSVPVPHSPTGLIRPGSQLGDDAQSIRSGRSLSSVASGSHRHAELTSPGLNASILETVSAWFEDGIVTRSVVFLSLIHI